MLEVLTALLIISNVYWAFIVNKLVNKLMSRNYFEFKQAEENPIETKTEPVVNEPDDFGALSELIRG